MFLNGDRPESATCAYLNVVTLSLNKFFEALHKAAEKKTKPIGSHSSKSESKQLDGKAQSQDPTKKSEGRECISQRDECNYCSCSFYSSYYFLYVTNSVSAP